jgi:hypothetical protein
LIASLCAPSGNPFFDFCTIHALRGVWLELLWQLD